MPLLLRGSLAAALLCLAGLVFGQEPGPGLEKQGDFRVLIDATGKLKSAAPLDATLGDELNRALLGVAKGITFEPAMRDGHPASFESQLHVVARFVSQPTGGYRLELVSASLSPQWLSRKAPVFPRGLDARKIGAVVVARAALMADGRIDPARTAVLQTATTPGAEASREPLERAALEALLASRFQPDLVDGKPIAMEVVQTFRFCGPECSITEPEPSAERLQLPRVSEAGVSAARVPAELVSHRTRVSGQPLRFRVAIDAAGAVSSASPISTGDAALLETTRSGLLKLHFFPATVQGRAVSSEMPVAVPVELDDGKARPQFARLAVDGGPLTMPHPRLTGLAGVRQGEVQARLHIFIGPGGRADRSASRVQDLEILPAGSVALERSLRTRFEEAIDLARAEPVLVDGEGITREFWYSYRSSFCVADGPCRPGTVAPPPPDPPAKLPAGIELARLKP